MLIRPEYFEVFCVEDQLRAFFHVKQVLHHQLNPHLQKFYLCHYWELTPGFIQTIHIHWISLTSSVCWFISINKHTKKIKVEDWTLQATSFLTCGKTMWCLIIIQRLPDDYAIRVRDIIIWFICLMAWVAMKAIVSHYTVFCQSSPELCFLEDQVCIGGPMPTITLLPNLVILCHPLAWCAHKVSLCFVWWFSDYLYL